MSKRSTKLKSGDTVIVIAGKDKGKVGKVKAVYAPQHSVRHETMSIVVENVNLKTCHEKPNPSKQLPGGRVKREAALHISNVAIYNPATQKADKVGFKFLTDGQKIRVYRSNGEAINA